MKYQVGDVKNLAKFSINNKWNATSGYKTVGKAESSILIDYHKDNAEKIGILESDYSLVGVKNNDVWVKSPIVPSLFVKLA